MNISGMKKRKHCTILVLVLVCGCFASSAEEKHDNTFVPTYQWQVIKEGQTIPKGLHIRINLQTGLKEAKLIETSVNTNNNKNALLEIPPNNEAGDSNVPNEVGDSKRDLSELQEALQNIKSDDILNPEQLKQTKDKFRTYEQLKKDLGDINLASETDAELLKKLIEKHKQIVPSPTTEAEILQVLEDIEFLVHQYDNANDFINFNGFNDLIYKNLNSSLKEIKRESLKLLGSSMQNNARVQIHCLESGCMDILLRLLANEQDSGIKSRTVFALSSLLRHFPLAQLKFVENAGLNVFSTLFDVVEDIKVQVKVVTLITDLLFEHRVLLEEKRAISSEKLRQYSDVNIINRIAQHKWCENLGKLLTNIVLVDKNDHDSIERCLLALFSVIDVCKTKLDGKVFEVLLQLQKQYRQLADNENREVTARESDFTIGGYYVHLGRLSNDIIRRSKIKPKVEL